MALSLAFLTLHQMRPQTKYVIWSRIDQKTCLKSILTANLTPVVIELKQEHDSLVTVEENVTAGGAGSAVLEYLADKGLSIPVLQLGLPDEFIKHGSQAEIRTELNLDAKGIEAQVKARFV